MTVTGGQEAKEGPWRVKFISYVHFLHSGVEAA
jgi:hypothetical protein